MKFQVVTRVPRYPWEESEDEVALNGKTVTLAEYLETADKPGAPRWNRAGRLGVSLMAEQGGTEFHGYFEVSTLAERCQAAAERSARGKLSLLWAPDLCLLFQPEGELTVWNSAEDPPDEEDEGGLYLWAEGRAKDCFGPDDATRYPWRASRTLRRDLLREAEFVRRVRSLWEGDGFGAKPRRAADPIRGTAW